MLDYIREFDQFTDEAVSKNIFTALFNKVNLYPEGTEAKEMVTPQEHMELLQKAMAGNYDINKLLGMGLSYHGIPELYHDLLKSEKNVISFLETPNMEEKLVEISKVQPIAATTIMSQYFKVIQ